MDKFNTLLNFGYSIAFILAVGLISQEYGLKNLGFRCAIIHSYLMLCGSDLMEEPN